MWTVFGKQTLKHRVTLPSHLTREIESETWIGIVVRESKEEATRWLEANRAHYREYDEWLVEHTPRQHSED